MTPPQFIIGIDLGTTHCALAASPTTSASVQLYDLPQSVGQGEVAAKSLLPSLIYLPIDGELPEGSTTLPWGNAPHVVGQWAGRLGSKVPQRLVASAKSWICHGGINRRAPILPWNTPDTEPQISPYQASVTFLEHLRCTWDSAHPNAPLVDQDVTVTVPASFDEAARELTLDAAREAGYGQKVRLIEEPQAAFYDFLGSHSDHIADTLHESSLVLVVDVGGGTTDLTLLKVVEDDGKNPEIERIAVGGHLLLGGDNMDAALAHHVLQKASYSDSLDPSEWSALVHSTRLAKEKLLGPNAPEEVIVSLQKRGSRLIGGTRSIPLTRSEVHELLVDGFLPKTAPHDLPERSTRAGLTTLGLPYATDPALPRHIAAFLRRHVQGAREAGATIQGGLPKPDRVLLNGGVFHAPALVDRLAEVFAHWFGGSPIPFLKQTSLSTAVACGAVRYGLAKRGVGQLIKGGTARAYYIGVQAQDETLRAFCVAPRGMQDNTSIDVSDRVLRVVLNRSVTFPLYVYTGDRSDPVGTVITVDEELEPMAPLQTVLRDKKAELHHENPTLPVTLGASLDENGALQLNLKTMELPPRRWRLQFAAQCEQPKKTTKTLNPPARLPDNFSNARRLLTDLFGKPVEPAKVKAVRRDLEDIVGPRGQWSAPTCRAIFDECLKHQNVRHESPEHEIQWLRLAGWGLRPGLGHAGDAGRVATLWGLFSQGVVHPSKANWAQWWILWRRIGPGLNIKQTTELYEHTHPWLLPETSPKKGPRISGQSEMMQMLAALEKLAPPKKVSIGEAFLRHPKKFGTWLPLGRLGSRAPLHGDETTVVDQNVAARWLETILALDWKKSEGAPFAATLLGRMTGDTNRDLGSDLRNQLARRLQESKAAPSWQQMVLEPTNLSDRDATRMLGEALPVGLRLDE